MPVDFWPVAFVVACLLGWDAWRRWLARHSADIANRLHSAEASIVLINEARRASSKSIADLLETAQEQRTKLLKLETDVMDAKAVAGKSALAGAVGGARRLVR